MKHKRVISAAVMLAVSIITVHANSAIRSFDGSDGTGVIILNEDCPLSVEHENLSFHIYDTPAVNSEGTSYDANVKAEYTIHNPSDMDIRAVLAFPFGPYPSYMPEEARKNLDLDKYQVQVNGEAIESELRVTYHGDGHTFSLEHDLPLLLDDFMEDEFYVPEMPVTEYTFRLEAEEAQPSHGAEAVFRDNEGRTKILLLPDDGGTYDAENGIYEAYIHVNGQQQVTLYVFGEDSGEPEWKFVSGRNDETEIDGTATLVSRNEYTLLDYVLRNFDESSGLFVTDWYNAYITMLKTSSGSGFVLTEPYRPLEYYLMRWYVYAVELEPGERLINTVTAPVYPEIDEGFDPAVYTYTYLLSPASAWSEFDSLDIRIETPLEMLDSVPEGFAREDNVYTMSLDHLPDEELEFKLCLETNPKKNNSYGTYIILLLAGGIIIPLILFILLVWLIIKAVKRKKQ